MEKQIQQTRYNSVSAVSDSPVSNGKLRRGIRISRQELYSTALNISRYYDYGPD